MILKVISKPVGLLWPQAARPQRRPKYLPVGHASRYLRLQLLGHSGQLLASCLGKVQLLCAGLAAAVRAGQAAGAPGGATVHLGQVKLGAGAAGGGGGEKGKKEAGVRLWPHERAKV